MPAPPVDARAPRGEKARLNTMALFSKPPTKKPIPGAGDGRPKIVSSQPAGRSPSAREVASHATSKGARGADRQPAEPAGDITVSGSSLIEWAPPGQPSFEVVQTNPGLCAVLEDAALRYASGHAAKARELLEQGVQTDHDTKISPLAWLALFDLQQRAGDKAAFDQFALKYVVQFERSAPAWEAAEKPTGPAPRRRLHRAHGQAHRRGGGAARRPQARDGETASGGAPRLHVGDGLRRRGCAAACGGARRGPPPEVPACSSSASKS